MRYEQLQQTISILKDIQELINSGLFNVDDIAYDLLESGAIDNDPEFFDAALDETLEILESLLTINVLKKISGGAKNENN